MVVEPPGTSVSLEETEAGVFSRTIGKEGNSSSELLAIQCLYTQIVT